MQVFKKPLQNENFKKQVINKNLTEFIKDAGGKLEAIQRFGDLTNLNDIKELKIKEELNMVANFIIHYLIENNEKVYNDNYNKLSPEL